MLGRGQQTSTGIGTFYQFWHIILIVSAVPGVIEKSQTALGMFFFAQIVMGFGTGLFKANVSPLVTEQYYHTKLFVVETKSGEHIILDPTLTVSHVYMHFHLFIDVGALVSEITMVYSEKMLTNVTQPALVHWLLASIPLDHISIICDDKKCAVAWWQASVRLALPQLPGRPKVHDTN
ncbi:hypothetical protein B0H14DRAFT_2584866 [Mycena olivaceomarginata]|nr:hypothetical protein B0H14DRAFT_2584866 [Mycena olivaceomarginata]